MEFRALTDVADESAVLYSYLFLLGREPENLEVIKHHASRGVTISDLRESAFSSEEFRKINVFRFAEAMFRGKLSSLGSLSYECNNTSDNIVMLQTSDSFSYSKILNVSQRYNKSFCKLKGLCYQQFRGIKFGSWSHHAMYNRIFLIWELVASGYRGWVFYLDADAIVVDPGWDIHEFLGSARGNGKSIILHSVLDEGDPGYNWWNTNDGVFMIDCGANHSRALIELWRDFYINLYNLHDLDRAENWHDIVDDQSSLWFIMQQLDKAVHFQREVHLTKFQFDKIYQSLRKDCMKADDSHGVNERVQDLLDAGARIWGSVQE